MIKWNVGLLLLLLSPLAYANGGDGMETLVVWFYTMIAISHGALVLLLRNLLIYKYLWWVIASLLFSVAALVVWTIALMVVVEYIPQDKLYLIASAVGLSLYLVIIVWAVITPLKQYRQLKGS